MSKKELRKLYRTKRNELTLEEIEQKSLAIANQCLTLPIWDQSIYSIFLSIAKLKEINTEYLLNILQGKDKNITVSKTDFENLNLHHYLLTDNTRIAVNSWGIPEPIDGIEIQAQQIDVVFMPLLAYDTKGNRVGYGKGFYDRFLAECKEDVLKIGLSLFPPETNLFETHENDIPLDYCVTPTKIYSFK